MEIQTKIVEYLKEKYHPEVILLGGSRAKGLERAISDWDLFLLGGEKNGEGIVEFESQTLDVTFKDWPEDDKFLTIPFGPLWPVKVLFVAEKDKLDDLLEKTKNAYESGPLGIYKELVLARPKKLGRWLEKMEQNQDDATVEFFYAGTFYELAIQLWFELQNKWSVSPREAVSIIKEGDQTFYQELKNFVETPSTNRLSVAKNIINKINSLYA